MTERVDVATSSDIAIAVELLRAQLREHDISLGDDALERGVAGYLEDASRGEILLARRGDRVVGVACVSFIWTLEHGGASAWLDELYVVPAERMRGVGGALLNAVMARAAARGDHAIDLEIERGHDRVASLYLRAGFERHARERWVKRLA